MSGCPSWPRCSSWLIRPDGYCRPTLGNICYSGYSPGPCEHASGKGELDECHLGLTAGLLLRVSGRFLPEPGSWGNCVLTNGFRSRSCCARDRTASRRAVAGHGRRPAVPGVRHPELRRGPGHQAVLQQRREDLAARSRPTVVHLTARHGNGDHPPGRLRLAGPRSGQLTGSGPNWFMIICPQRTETLRPGAGTRAEGPGSDGLHPRQPLPRQGRHRPASR